MPRGVYSRGSKNEKPSEIKMPEGCSVVTRTNELELYFRNKNKWLPFAQKLQTISGMQALQIELGDLKDMPNSKTRINSIKSGIKSAWIALGHKSGKVQTGVHNGRLYVWVNGR